ncbi:MAG: LysR family transcriptional regulator, partial [Burkholderiales bacterium]
MTDRLRHATLRQLQIFIIAGETSSLARAAEALHLTQPAVSMQMSQLSELVGVPLFEKRGRNLVLSPAGQTLLPYAQRVAQSLRDASDALDALLGVHQGKVKIALVTTTRYFAPRLIAQFHTQHPHIELDVSIANREAVIAQLEAGEVDLAIMGRPPPHVAVVAEPFARHPHG